MIASSMLIALYTPSTETQGNILNPIVDDYEYVSKHRTATQIRSIK